MSARRGSIPLAVLLCMAAAPFPAAADDAFDACLKTVGPEDTRCGEEWIARAEARLDAAWKHLMEVAEGDIAKGLTAEQGAWVVFRDLSCKFKLDEGFGGASGPNGYHACRAEVISDRASAIEAYTKYIDN